MTDREALQIAFNALVSIDRETPYPIAKHAIKCIKAVFNTQAQPEQQLVTDLRKAAEMALEALEHVDRFDLNRRFCFDEEIDALHAALAQGEQTQPDHYAEVYIRVGDLHVKKVMTSIEFFQSNDPIKLLSFRADNALREIKEML